MEDNNALPHAPRVKQAAQKGIVLEQLRQVPIVQVACRKAGVSRATFYRMRAEDPEFEAAVAKAIEEGVAFINDMSESQVVSLIKDRNWPAISFWLKAHHSSYRTKVDVDARIIDAQEALTEEQKTIITRALRLASLTGEDDSSNKQQEDGKSEQR